MKKFSYAIMFATLPIYYVNAVEVDTSAEFRNALTNGDNIILGANITVSDTENGITWNTPVFNSGSSNNNITINGNGHTVYGGDIETNMFRNWKTIDSIENITFDGFYNNPEVSASGDDELGAVIMNVGKINKIDANFYNNTAYHGAAIFNGSGYEIGSINGNFIGNKTIGATWEHGHEASGAAIHNQGIIKNITGYFKNNNGWMHGTIWNYGTIENITATFEENYRSAVGGNGGSVTITNSEFIKNTTWQGRQGEGQAGAAIHSYGTNFTIKETVFTENSAWWTGGAVYSTRGSLDISDSTFTKNSAGEDGGAIYKTGGTGTISNTTFTSNSGRNGGAIYNTTNTTITDSSFNSNNSSVNGGAIYNGGTLNISNSEIVGNKASVGGAIYATANSSSTLTNVDIKNNTTSNAQAGAIHSLANITLQADGKDMIVSGNNTNTNQIAMYMVTADTTLYLKNLNDGNIAIDDKIDGIDYNIEISGDLTGHVRFNNELNNLKALKMSDGGQLFVAKDDVFAMKSYIASAINENTPALLMDIELNADGTLNNGLFNISGDVEGTTNVILNSLNTNEVDDPYSILSPFVIAPNDNKNTSATFKVAAVYGSPYMYEALYNIKGDEEGSVWYLGMTEIITPEPNPEPEPDNPIPTPTPQPSINIEVRPEVIATVAVKTAGLSQTNGMVYNIMRKVGVNRLFCPGCGFYDYNWDGEAFHNVWVDTTYNGLTIEAPVEIDAKVWGIEAGSDLQHDLNNKLGIFVSYRQGNYEMDGKGEKYYSNIGSEIDIDSYLAGLYYRYDRNNWYAFATLYGGMQNTEIKTDDGVANYDTDGIEFGGSIEAGYNYALTRKLSVTPSLGAFYSQISYDDATDNVGKTVNYNDLKQVELEAGAKFAYTQYTDDGFYSLYVKPSVVQTLIDGDEIEVTKLGKVDTVEDQTLGRVEIGGNYGFNDNWSAYGWANYTFGSDYEATSLGAGLNYAW